MTTLSIASQLADPSSQSDGRWRSVQRRDRGADGQFVYAVRTTGVYCRPSCGARRARRENVEFFGAPGDAERAGYRPCKRCRPDQNVSAHEQVVARACRAIAASDRAPDLQSLARDAGLSASQFHRVFKSLTGVTPKAYAAAHRSQRVRAALRSGRSVTAAAYTAGFGSSSRFYAASGAMLGMSPARFRAGGAGETIRFAAGECSLGSIVVAATVRGICAVALGDEPGKLLRDLQDQFPNAQLIGADGTYERWVGEVVAFVDRPSCGLRLPLDIRGTAFQMRVWEALRQIPRGSTRTYAQLAASLGRPSASRAVARACAANPIAVAIPCHRVVRTGGSLSGYRWGIQRKAQLLKMEQETS